MTFQTAVDPVSRALWFIESHFSDDLSLDDIANASGASRYHLSRAFAAVMRTPVMRYVRARRLTEAARRLASGAPDILSVALDARYGSHEAFTRAFTEQFGCTPESLRKDGNLGKVALQEPLRKDPIVNVTLNSPRIENGRLMLIAGIQRRYSQETIGGIPSQWQQFVPHIGHVPSQIGDVTYGVCLNSDDDGNIEYLSGVEVRSFDGLPPDFATLRLPARRYAVFTHEGHISAIRATWQAIFTSGLPSIGEEMSDAPDFERYDERFDGRTGNGAVEIWVPLKA